MPVIRPVPAEQAEAICCWLEENGVPGYHREMNPAYHRANAWEYIASPPGNWPYISVDGQCDRAIVITRDFDTLQTRSFYCFLPADLIALVAHVKQLHETMEDCPGPLDRMAQAIADRLRQYGLNVVVLSSDTARSVQALDTPSFPSDKWIAINLINEDSSVRCEVSEECGYEGAESIRDIYKETWAQQDFDSETVIPRLVARLLI